MAVLVWLSCLTFGSEVDRLGDRDYFTRAAAHQRLKAAGVWAWPALAAGLKTADPEGRMRIEMIRACQLAPDERLAYALSRYVVWGDATDAELEVVASVMQWSPVVADEVYWYMDKMKAFQTDDTKRWVEQRPYMNKTLAGDAVYAMKQVRSKVRSKVRATRVPSLFGFAGLTPHE